MSTPLDELFGTGAARELRCTSGEALFRAGDPVERLHRVEEGEVWLLRTRPDGAPLVLQRARAGSLLAEASLWSQRYHCDAVAMVASRTRWVGAAALRTRLAAEPELALAFAARLARCVQEARQRAEILALPRLADRLDAWFAARPEGLPPRGNWRRLAEELGVRPEALYRELGRRRRSPRVPEDRGRPRL